MHSHCTGLCDEASLYTRYKLPAKAWRLRHAARGATWVAVRAQRASVCLFGTGSSGKDVVSEDPSFSLASAVCTGGGYKHRFMVQVILL